MRGIGGGMKMKRITLFQWFDKFSTAMKDVLVERQSLGWTGWNKIATSTLKIRLLNNVESGDWIDVANLAFFLWVRKEKP